MERVVVGGVYVRFGGGYSNFDFILILPSLDDTEIRADFIVTLCTPRDVVYVGELSGKVRVSGTNHSHVATRSAYRIDVQNIDVGGCNHKILEEGSDHMPRFKLSPNQLPLG